MSMPLLEAGIPKEASLLSPPQGSSAAAVFCREAKRAEFRVFGERTDARSLSSSQSDVP